MSEITTIDLPHRLGKAEAIRRIRSRTGDLRSHLPGGGMADIKESWPAPDRMDLDIRVLGQSARATLDIGEALVRVTLQLPGMLGFMSAAIASAVRDRGQKLLLEDGSKSAA